MNTPPIDAIDDDTLTPPLTPTPRNRRGLFPPDTPYISRHRRRNSQPSNRTKKEKITKEKITGNTTVTPNHLLRFLIFSERKLALTTIRKDALHYTLSSMKQKVPKSANLVRMLDALSSAYEYDTLKDRIIRKLIRVQGYIRAFLKNRLKRLSGPGLPVSRCINEDCPYSLEALSDIPVDRLMTWREPFKGVPSKIYGCDGDMMVESLRRCIRTGHISKLENPHTNLGECLAGLQNPFTREGLTVDVIRRCNEYALLKNKKPLYKSSTRRRSSRRRTTTSQDLHRSRMVRRRGIGSRRFNIVTSEFDDDMVMTNERQTSSTSAPLLQINILSPHMVGRTHAEAIRKLEQVIPIAEAVSESFRDLEFYTQETMLTRPIRDMIGLLRATSSGVSTDILEEAVEYLGEHIQPLAHALTIGSRYAAITSVISRVTADTNRVPPMLRDRVRNVLRFFNEGTLEYMVRGVRNAVRTTRRRPQLNMNHILSIADMVYRAIGGILVLAHPSLREFPELVTEDDRKSFAIIIIGSLFEGSYLSDEFSWARFLE